MSKCLKSTCNGLSNPGSYPRLGTLLTPPEIRANPVSLSMAGMRVPWAVHAPPRPWLRNTK